MDLKQEFSKNLKILRKQRGLTQEELAELVSVDFRHISYLETAKSFPSCALIERLCAALNVTYSQLFDFETEIPNEELIKKINNIIEKYDNKRLLYVFKMVNSL